MLRIGGAALLLASSFFLAAEAAAGERRRLRHYEGLLAFVRFVRAQVEGARRPMPQICAAFYHKELAECGFLPLLQRQGLAVALQEGEGLLGLEAEELRPLFAFAATLGKGEAEGEVQLCIRTEAELERGLLRRREEAPRRTRVSQTLSISGALMLLLLLL